MLLLPKLWYASPLFKGKRMMGYHSRGNCLTWVWCSTMVQVTDFWFGCCIPGVGDSGNEWMGDIFGETDNDWHVHHVVNDIHMDDGSFISRWWDMRDGSGISVRHIQHHIQQLAITDIESTMHFEDHSTQWKSRQVSEQLASSTNECMEAKHEDLDANMDIWRRLPWLITNGCWINTICGLDTKDIKHERDWKLDAQQQQQPLDWMMASNNDQQSQQRLRILVPDTDYYIYQCWSALTSPPTQLLHQTQPWHHIQSSKRIYTWIPFHPANCHDRQETQYLGMIGAIIRHLWYEWGSWAWFGYESVTSITWRRT